MYSLKWYSNVKAAEKVEFSQYFPIGCYLYLGPGLLYTIQRKFALMNISVRMCSIFLFLYGLCYDFLIMNIRFLMLDEINVVRDGWYFWCRHAMYFNCISIISELLLVSSSPYLHVRLCYIRLLFFFFCLRMFDPLISLITLTW